jgi:hypothetical protein
MSGWPDLLDSLYFLRSPNEICQTWRINQNWLSGNRALLCGNEEEIELIKFIFDLLQRNHCMSTPQKDDLILNQKTIKRPNKVPCQKISRWCGRSLKSMLRCAVYSRFKKVVTLKNGSNASQIRADGWFQSPPPRNCYSWTNPRSKDTASHPL